MAKETEAIASDCGLKAFISRSTTQHSKQLQMRSACKHLLILAREK
jgi:hypothetical protein